MIGCCNMVFGFRLFFICACWPCYGWVLFRWELVFVGWFYVELHWVVVFGLVQFDFGWLVWFKLVLNLIGMVYCCLILIFVWFGLLVV